MKDDTLEIAEKCGAIVTHPYSTDHMVEMRASQLEAFRAEIERRAVPEGWQPIETAPSGVPVLIFYVNAYGKSRVIKARHIARFTEEATYDSCEEGVDEYDEANDRYTYREGWWEMIDNWEDYGFVVVHEGTPTHWRPLPAAPELRNAKEV